MDSTQYVTYTRRNNYRAENAPETDWHPKLQCLPSSSLVPPQKPSFANRQRSVQARSSVGETVDAKVRRAADGFDEPGAGRAAFEVRIELEEDLLLAPFNGDDMLAAVKHLCERREVHWDLDHPVGFGRLSQRIELVHTLHEEDRVEQLAVCEQPLRLREGWWWVVLVNSPSTVGTVESLMVTTASDALTVLDDVAARACLRFAALSEDVSAVSVVAA